MTRLSFYVARSLRCRPRAGGGPYSRPGRMDPAFGAWIPAFAGMTCGDISDFAIAILAHSRGNLKPPGLSDRPRPAHTIDQRARILGFRFGAPGHVAVRSHQHEAALVSLAHLRRIERNDLERHAGRGRRAHQVSAVGRIGAEPQQHEAAPIEVERGAAVRQPYVRRTRPRSRGLRIGLAFERRRGRAVRPYDGRVIVAVAEVIAVHEPLVAHDLG